MQSETTTLHSRAQQPTFGQVHAMYDQEDKLKTGFRSSSFYRTRIRGSRYNGLVFSISVALATLLIYYLVYWRNDRGVSEVGEDNRMDHGVFENANPKFDGLNKRVELENDARRAGDGGWDDKGRREDFINQDKGRQDYEPQVNPQRMGDRRSNDLPREHRGRINQKNEDRFQPENHFNPEEDPIYDGNGDREQRIQDQPRKVGPRINKPRIVHNNDFEGLKVGDDMREAVPRPKPQFNRNPPKVLPVGREGGIILNHRGDLKDINPKDVAPIMPDVLGRQPGKKNDFALEVPREVNPDYLGVQQHNMDPRNQPKLPKFKPNRHIDPLAHDPADMKPKPRPKEFPVTVLQKPDPTSCPTNRFVLILVLSQVHEISSRGTIRKTWGDPFKFHIFGTAEVDMTWWVVFAMGSGKTDNKIELENDKNGDILQGDFIDIESEQTRKVMMAMKWLHELQASNPRCRPTYFLKTGSNVFVNARVLTRWMVNEFKQTENVYTGQVIRNDDPIRDSFDPHFVPYSDFREEVFPDLAQGPTYMLSTDVVHQMVPLFDRVIPIAMDDAYIGILASVLNIKPMHDEHFVHPRRPSNVCHYKNMMYIYGVSLHEIKHVYNVIMGHTDRHCLNQGL
nr:uncharacterized protein LOC129277625 [Lytechinus pictus]